MSEYPVAYRQVPPEKRSRLAVFFRILLAIPHAIWSIFYGFAFGIVVFIAWFAIVFTARWPRGLYDFAAGYLRFFGRLSAYMCLVTDAYPPFDGGEHPEYPVQVVIAPPKERYSRVKTFFASSSRSRSRSCSTSSCCGCTCWRSRSGSSPCSPGAPAWT